MRRPLLITFIVILIYTLFFTHYKLDIGKYKDEIVTIKGTIKYKSSKKIYNEYSIDGYLVKDYNKRSNMKIGDIVIVNGKIKNINNLKYKDFDYGRYIKSLGYTGLIYLNDYKKVDKDSLYSVIGVSKDYVRETLRYLYKYNSDFLNSLILGEKENLNEEQKNVFAKTGTSHVIAISGLHTGILCALVTFILYGINKYFKFVLLIVLMSCYSILVGNSPSIIRSIFFLASLYLGIFWDRRKDSISILSLIGIILVVDNPYIIYNLSFQLSFMATLSIIYFYGYINKFIRASIISLTISSNILTLPIIYYNFKGVSLSSILGNVILIPFVSIIMILCIASIGLFNISITLSKLLAYINSTIISFILDSLERLSKLEVLYINISNPNIYYVITYYIIIFSYLVYREKRLMKEQENVLQGYYKEY